MSSANSTTIKRELTDIEDYNKYYSVRVYCQNCSHHDSVYVRKGSKKPVIVRCARCECDIWNALNPNTEATHVKP